MSYIGKAGLSLDNIFSFTTNDLVEGTNNLYFTNTRANSAIDLYLDGSNDISVSNGNISLNDTGVVAGTYGSATSIPIITLDSKGRVTVATSHDIDATTIDGLDSSAFAQLSATNNTFTGTITHGGLIPSSGTTIDQIQTYTKSLSLTADWQDVGIDSTDLATGTYIVQLYANDISAGGYNSNEYYSGTMSWYSGTTNSNSELPSDEIVLHRAGGSDDGNIYLRTYKSSSPNPIGLKLQIYSNYANTSASNYVFKFRRMI